MLDTSELYDALGGNRDASNKPEKDVIERFRSEDALNVPIALTDMELWANYVNDDLYAMDKKIREFFDKTKHQRKKNNGFKTTASVMFAWIYGRKPTPHDSSVCRMINKILMYYCTSYINNTTFMGKKVGRVYEFSKYSVTSKRPYSLKLRLEEMDEGKDPFRASGYGNPEKQRHGRRKHSEAGE